MSRFWPERAEIISQKSLRNLGGRDLDVAVAKRLAQAFEAAHGIDVTDIPKAWF